MKKIRRLLSLMTAFVIAAGSISAAFTTANAAEIDDQPSQTQDRTMYYVKDYTLTGNYIVDYLNVARAQMGKTKSQLHYTESWCANFANDCARLTGMPDNIIPYNYGMRASCAYMYEYMLDYCNARIIDRAEDTQPGDLVFYYCPAAGFFLHVGIIENSDYFIEGNRKYYDSEPERKVCHLSFNYNYKCYVHPTGINDYESGHVERIYVRPNYGVQAPKMFESKIPDDYALPEKTLEYDGSSVFYGRGVAWVQAVLGQAGFLNKIDARYDEETRNAVNAFFRSKGLPETGIVDENAAKLLQEEWELLKNPQIDNAKINQSRFHYYNDTVSFTADIKRADKAELVVKSGENELFRKEGSSVSVPAEDFKPGEYTAYFEAKNEYSTVTSDIMSFTVESFEPGEPHFKGTDADTYSTAVFTWKTADKAESYTIKISDENSGEEYITKSGIEDRRFAIKLPEGKYTADITSVNKIASTKGNAVSFTVNEGKPSDLGESFYAQMKINQNNTSIGIKKIAPIVIDGSQGGTVWYFTRQENGSYIIKECEDGRVLTLLKDGSAEVREANGSAEQQWYIGINGKGQMLIPFSDESKILRCTKDGVYCAVSDGSVGEEISIVEVNAVHDYHITSYTEEQGGTIERVVYECSICGDVHEKRSGNDLPDTPDSPDTADTADSADAASHGNKSDIDPIDKIIILGDVDRDRVLTIDDSFKILRFTVGLEELNYRQQIIADVNADDTVDTADVMLIARYVLKLPQRSQTGDTVIIAAE